MENIQDDKLIEDARKGDKESLNLLMDKYTQLASKIARSYFLIGADYEDLLQDAMIGLFNAYNNYIIGSSASFSTFARMCIERNIQSEVKKANSKKNQILSGAVSLTNQGEIILNEDDDGEINIVIPSNALSPDQKLEQRESLKQIKEQIISSLSKFELKVLILFLQGYKYTQIAQKLGLNSKSVDNALSRIKNKLSYLKKN